MSEITEKLGKVFESVKGIGGIHSLRSGTDIKPSIDLIDKITKELKSVKDLLLENSCDDVITFVTTITVGSFKTNYHLNRIRYEKSTVYPRQVFLKGGKDGKYIELTKEEIEKITSSIGEKVMVIKKEYSDDLGETETKEVVSRSEIVSDLWNFSEKGRVQTSFQGLQD
jgi:hypothetical protein